MEQEKLSRHYEGSVASTYDEHKKKSPKWQAEQKVVEQILATYPEGLRVIDIPVGTGRFFESYKRGHHRVVGMDISEAMLSQARAHPLAGQLEPELVTGDIFDLHFPDRSFDLAVCIRFMNLVRTELVNRSLRELARVTCDSVIVGIRHRLTIEELKPYTRSGATKLVRQVRSRIRKRVEGKVVFHRGRAIREIFRESGLQVARKECIEHRGDGTDYYIYVLQHGKDVDP